MTMTTSLETFGKISCCLAREGDVEGLSYLLAQGSVEEIQKQLNSTVHHLFSQKLTPLIVASVYGRNDVVKLLLNKYKVDVEVEGIVEFIGHVPKKGVTALWCAAFEGHLEVVKTLINFGADVSHPDAENTTPLQAACYGGYSEIVCVLINHGADINSVKPCGYSALHIAASFGHVNTVAELLRLGAKVTRASNNKTPIQVAAIALQYETVEFFTTHPCYSKVEKIEGLELLGACCAHSLKQCQIDKAFYYLEAAMKQRYSDIDSVVAKKVLPPNPAYGNRIECQTLQDLVAVSFDTDALRIECLIILERILGLKDNNVFNAIVNYGKILAQNSRTFNQGVLLWLHALKSSLLHMDRYLGILSDFLCCIAESIIAKMQRREIDMSLFHQIKQVLEASVDVLKKGIEDSTAKVQEFGSSPENIDREIQLKVAELSGNAFRKEVLYRALLHLLYMLVISRHRYVDKDFEIQVRQLGIQLVQLNLEQYYGKSLLHECMCENLELLLTLRCICGETYDELSCLPLAQFLVRCGANVNALTTTNRDTPLHILVKQKRNQRYQSAVQEIITLLVGAGAHLDVLNANRETPLEVAIDNDVKEFLRSLTEISLKCLAARAVVNYQVPYVNIVPEILIPFVEMHA